MEEGQRGQGAYQPPEKDLAGGLHVGVGQIVQLGHKHRVGRPGQGRAQGEQVAQGAELHRPAAGEGDQHDAAHGHAEAHEEGGAGPGRHAQGPEGQGGEHGGRREDNAHVGGQRVGQGQVLEQEVEGQAGEAGPHEEQLLPRGTGLQRPGGAQEQHKPGQREAEDQQLHGLEPPLEHLCGDEDGAPDRDGEQGQQMAGKLPAAVSHGGRLPSLVKLARVGAAFLPERKKVRGAGSRSAHHDSIFQLDNPD